MTNAPLQELRFAEFVLDVANARLRRGRHGVTLRPKTLALLCQLAERAGNLVSKAELMDSVWRDAVVGDWVLAGCVQELRDILGDDPRRPRFIETVHRRGYRFIAAVEHGGATSGSAPANGNNENRPEIVGRDNELAELGQWLDDALAGRRQFGFVVGEAGIGKTVLIDCFSRTALARHADLLGAHGQCIEWRSRGESATSEPYLPVIEALARTCSTAAGASLLARLRRFAPSWLCLLPGVLEPDEADGMRRGLLGTTGSRLALEMTALLANLPQPLLLVLEDLHWSDSATLELVAAVAQRRDAARLLIIGTYRPADAAMLEHPMRALHHSMRTRGQCRDLWLHPFGQSDVRDYLGVRCPQLWDRNSDALARSILERTDGNPLFVRSVVEHLETEGVLDADGGDGSFDAARLVIGIPLGLRQMLTAQVDQLDDADRAALESGSLCGNQFSAEAVAAATEEAVIEIENRLERLARHGQIVRSIGERPWPDGSVAGAYEFTHSLYEEVLREGIPPAARRRGHRRIALRLEKAWRGRTSEIAADLAAHFEAGGDAEMAAAHVEEAARNASRVGAHGEAVALLERSLTRLEALPRSPAVMLRMIRLYLALGQARHAPLGFTSAAVEQAFERARDVAAELDDPVQLFQATIALTSTYTSQARFTAAIESSRRGFALLARVPLPAFEFASNLTAAQVLFHSGDPEEARAMLEKALTFDDIPRFASWMNFHAHALNYLSLTLVQLGHPDLARERVREAAALAASVGVPFDRASAAMFSCFVHLNLRDVPGLRAAANEAEKLAREYGFPLQSAVGTFSRGYCEFAGGNAHDGLKTMDEGLASYRASGQRTALIRLLCILADAHACAGNAAPADALAKEATAMLAVTGERRIGADLDRVRSQLCLIDGDSAAAERYLRQSLSAAHNEKARWLELRASVSLGELLQSNGRRREALEVLRPVVDPFSEGSDLPDVVRARDLLARAGATERRRGAPRSPSAHGER